MKIRKYYTSRRYAALFIIIFIVFGWQSCGDCGLETMEYPCRIREATITQFNPRLVILPDSTVYPSPAYSIHTFAFPYDNSSSGVLTNDMRYDQSRYMKQYLIIARKAFEANGKGLEARLVSYHPTNPLMVGDIMVVDVDTDATPNTAAIRFYGSLARFPDDFLSEDAYKFCEEYLKGYREADEDYDEISSRISRYGANLPNAISSTLDKDDIIVVDSKGRDVTDIYKDIIPTSIIDALISNGDATALDLIVRPGEVYYYKARNGKAFAVIIVDILHGSFEPYMRRVTIKFSELRGMKVSECG